jgi:hypothetical protein
VHHSDGDGPGFPVEVDSGSPFVRFCTSHSFLKPIFVIDSIPPSIMYRHDHVAHA